MGCTTSNVIPEPTQKELFQRDMALLVSDDPHIALFLEVPLKIAHSYGITDPYRMFFDVTEFIIMLAYAYPDYHTMAKIVAFVNRDWFTDYFKMEVPKWTSSIRDVAFKVSVAIGNSPLLMYKMSEYRDERTKEILFICLYTRCIHDRILCLQRQGVLNELQHMEDITKRAALLLDDIKPFIHPPPLVTSDIIILEADYPPPYTK